jgi:putative redox protein
MPEVTAVIKEIPYRIEIKSPTGNVVVADEPVDKGGKDIGFSPKELLASALAACTTATVKMFADRKKWDLRSVDLTVDLDQNEATNETVLNRKIHFNGNLSDEQRSILLKVANGCPIHKILTNPISINTSLT